MADLPDYYTQSQLALAEVKYLDGGLDAAKATTPTRKQVYLATDTNKLYFCFTDGEWADITGLYLLLTGGTMSGAIAMGANKITGLANPTLAQDAATKAYADALEPYTDEEAVAAVEAAGLTLAAAKKIILANDGVIQLGTLEGSPILFGGVAGQEYVAWVQAKEGNRYGRLTVLPIGTENEAILSVRNTDDMVNFGYFEFVVRAAVAYIMGGKEGTGTEPTHLYINLDPSPYVNEANSLGEAAYRWLESWVMHRQFAHPLPVDHTWAGNVAQMYAGTALTIGQACYVGGDTKMEKALASAAATMPAMAIATGTIAENAWGQFLLQGFFRDDTWGWTIGGLLYVDEDTAGALTQELPAVAGEQVQVVGVAMSADIIYFNPSFELVEIS